MLPSPAERAGPPGLFAFTVVVPFFNEANGVELFLEEHSTGLSRQAGDAELVLVDDGSSDETAAILQRIASGRPGWRVVRQSPNQGQAAALYRGMRLASAPLIVTLDGDGQNDPADIAPMLARLAESGADLVAGVRVQR